ncbi:hypothetical protein [Clostridium kluyveri]|uniref:Uncharacterized protein n=1 Tax=Clostridium kluyveri TaxID=1534 RepID=A0A1L5F488_CLOKL|nr:hypothetical protein [Clostridium kluyveri]APM37813.1 hypothetical protein BS101_03190 [Clostridium kluyveri]
MGSVKYSKIKTSNGMINFNINDDTKIHEFDCDNYEYLKVYSASGRLKLYINYSNDYISIGAGNGLIEFELKDFQINHVKFELDDVPNFVGEGYLQYYLCK